MNRIYACILTTFIFLAFFILFSGNKKLAEPSVVVIKKADGKFSLFRNNKPYYIKGGGGRSNYKKLKECGGNSVRLWSSKGARPYLDSAFAQGLTVTLGLEMALERQGFNYSDEKAVKAQFEELKKEILTYKDHPALLMWGIGNELELFAKNYKVWNAVNDIAKFIHETDPNHPASTMIAGVPKDHVTEIIKRCPDLDVLSVNAFKDLPYIKEKIKDSGWKGPYVITEWGATGYWEAPKTSWGAFYEETSSEKSSAIKSRYEGAILPNTDLCLGSYVFYWGNKQERTSTVLSLFLESGEETSMIDMMQKLWTGEWPSNRAPQIAPVLIDNKKSQKNIFLIPGTTHTASTDATDPDKDPLTYKWEIYFESNEKKTGGDYEESPPALNELILNGTSKQLSFKAPPFEGAYRLYVYVFDGKNKAATANIPFYVKKQ